MSEWVDYVGPFASTQDVREYLHIDQIELDRRLANHELFGLTFSDGSTYLPTRQFQHGRVVEGLRDVLEILATGPFDATTWATWMAGNPGDGITHWERLRAGELNLVLTEARRDVGRWNQ